MPGGLTTASVNTFFISKKKSGTDAEAMANEIRPYESRNIRIMKGVITDA